jgi:hypothetical protein
MSEHGQGIIHVRNQKSGGKMSVREWLNVLGDAQTIRERVTSVCHYSALNPDAFMTEGGHHFYLGESTGQFSMFSFNYGVIPEVVIRALLPSPEAFTWMAYGVEQSVYFQGNVLDWRQYAQGLGLSIQQFPIRED